jgi:hypothetical protein
VALKEEAEMSGKFNRLTPIWPVGKDKWNKAIWLCACDCGNLTFVALTDVTRKTKATKSCGCLNKELVTARSYKHGHARRGLKPAEYDAFVMMKQRCTNPAVDGFKYYGGRGIKFKFTSFKQFYDEVGDKPSANHSIDRIKNDGHYEVGNVKWSTASEQAYNRRPKGSI